MNEVDWSKAPEGAEWAEENTRLPDFLWWYKFYVFQCYLWCPVTCKWSAIMATRADINKRMATWIKRPEVTAVKPHKLEWLRKLLDEVIAGRVLQLNFNNGNWKETKRTPSFNSCEENWRTVEAKPKVVDLTPLEGTDVLCEFHNSVVGIKPLFGHLGHINRDGLFVDHNGDYFRYCRPVLNKWHAATGDVAACDTGLEYSTLTYATVSLVKFTGLKAGFTWN